MRSVDVGPQRIEDRSRVGPIDDADALVTPTQPGFEEGDDELVTLTASGIQAADVVALDHLDAVNAELDVIHAEVPPIGWSGRTLRVALAAVKEGRADGVRSPR